MYLVLLMLLWWTSRMIVVIGTYARSTTRTTTTPESISEKHLIWTARWGEGDQQQCRWEGRSSRAKLLDANCLPRELVRADGHFLMIAIRCRRRCWRVGEDFALCPNPVMGWVDFYSSALSSRDIQGWKKNTIYLWLSTYQCTKIPTKATIFFSVIQQWL